MNNVKTWKDIPGYEGLYVMNDQGKIRRWEITKTVTYTVPGRVMTATRPHVGMGQVMLCKNGVKKNLAVKKTFNLLFPKKENQND